MKKVKLLFLACLLFIISLVIFIFLEVGWVFNDLFKLISPLLFALSLTIMVFYPSLRKIFLYGSLFLLVAMVFFYLLNLMDLSNWIGSLGFGILIIVVLCNLPNLIKKGYMETFD